MVIQQLLLSYGKAVMKTQCKLLGNKEFWTSIDTSIAWPWQVPFQQKMLGIQNLFQYVQG
jgi:hypothetical protein